MYRENLKSKICKGKDFDDISPEEYYYLLGQILVYIFEKMGGADSHRREFSYLTSPTIPCDAAKLNRRVIHFLENVPRILGSIDNCPREVLNSLLTWNSIHKEFNVNLKSCEEAFYAGIYEKNLFL